jgi:hypothetical protein
VIRVEAAKKVLVRFAAPGVLDRHEAGGNAEDVLHRPYRAKREVAIAHGRRRCRADGPSAENERRLRVLLLDRRRGWRRRGGRGRRRGDRRWFERNRELDHGFYRGARFFRGIEGPSSHGGQGGFVEPVPRRLNDARVDDASGFVDGELDAHDTRDAIAKRVRGVHGIGVRLQRRRRYARAGIGGRWWRILRAAEDREATDRQP